MPFLVDSREAELTLIPDQWRLQPHTHYPTEVSDELSMSFPRGVEDGNQNSGRESHDAMH